MMEFFSRLTNGAEHNFDVHSTNPNGKRSMHFTHTQKPPTHTKTKRVPVFRYTCAENLQNFRRLEYLRRKIVVRCCVIVLCSSFQLWLWKSEVNLCVMISVRIRVKVTLGHFPKYFFTKLGSPQPPFLLP